MNSFAHALPFLNHDQYFSIGCAIPDWLGAVDRRCRVRRNGAEKFLLDEDSLVANLAGGIVQHIDDDRWFHQGERFTKLSMEFSVELRELLVEDPGFRPGFVGHVIIELLLDGFLHKCNPGKLDHFYGLVENSDPEKIQAAVNQMATRPTDKLASYFPIFLREKYLYDYLDDERLLMRMNFVLKRVKLNPMGKEVLNWIPNARKRVDESAAELLSGFGPEVLVSLKEQ